MISRVSLNERVQEWGLREDVVEKDYVLGWVLWGIGPEPSLREHWVFKGGTCLKKCYIETYRFSEDLDFTVLERGPLAADDVLPILRGLLDRVNQASGIDFSVEAPRLRLRNARRAAEGRVYYIGPRGTPGPASIKLDLDGEEGVLRPTQWRPIAHAYDDGLPGPATVQCYSFLEVFAEKLRAMGERGRPRDLYDIVNLFRLADLRPEPETLRSLFAEKCDRKGIAVPTFASLQASETRAELASEWASMLAHQLPKLPPLASFWRELESLFRWLEGVGAPTVLASMPVSTPTSAWVPPPTIRTWGGNPVELLRYAAQNRLIAEFGYTDEDGRSSSRRVEPYRLWETLDGNIVLGAHDVGRGARRSFRVDRIRSPRVTDEPFEPRYAIEVGSASFSPQRAPNVLRSEPRMPGPRSISKPRRSKGQPRHVIQCPICQKRFYRDRHDTRLREHMAPGGWKCMGRTGVYLGIA
jgi:predicted nucleotidyltransferase component of viral defense system